MAKVFVIQRSGRKGQLVKYPKKWEKRVTHTGLRRFDTSCDLLVGVCACGHKHTLEDDWVRRYLEDYEARVETLDEWQQRTNATAPENAA